MSQQLAESSMVILNPLPNVSRKIENQLNKLLIITCLISFIYCLSLQFDTHRDLLFNVTQLILFNGLFLFVSNMSTIHNRPLMTSIFDNFFPLPWHHEVCKEYLSLSLSLSLSWSCIFRDLRDANM